MCSPPWATSFFSFGGFLGFSGFFGFSVLLASALRATPFNTEARSASEELLMFVAGGDPLCVRPDEASSVVKKKEEEEEEEEKVPRVLLLLRVCYYVITFILCIYF